MRTLLLLAAALSACEPPESNQPLSDPATAKPDSRLAGRFAGKLDENDCFIHLAPGKGAVTDLVVVVSEKEKGAHILHWQAFPTTIGGKSYLNLQRKTFTDPYAEKFEVSPTFIFARYEIRKDGSLMLWSMKEDLVKEAVAAHTLEGELKDGNVKLRSATARLAGFVEKADSAKLFSLFGTFKRL